MKIRPLLFLFFLLSVTSSFAQELAWNRALKIGKGMNLTWLDQRWNGTEGAAHRDYVNMSDLPLYKEQIEIMHEMGYRFLRFPVCFDLWYSDEKPYTLVTPEYYTALDSVVSWTKKYNMKISIDYHHGHLKSESLEDDVTRICAIWKNVATRYKDTDPERVFFEIFNEPADVNEYEWQESAERIINSIRSVDQKHTLIVGGAQWNNMDALLRMPELEDTNLIYTFHYYDPFLFTHQGAEWAGDAASTTGMPYPYNARHMPAINPAAANTWAAGAYQRYSAEANYQAMFTRIKRVKDWSVKHHKPVFCGEWGAYSKYPAPTDRCMYLKDVYTILDTLAIPNAMWEWKDGFSYFEGTPDPAHVSPCMKDAMRLK